MTLQADRISASILPGLSTDPKSGTVHSVFRRAVNILCDDMTWLSLHPSGQPMNAYAVSVPVESATADDFRSCESGSGDAAAGSVPAGGVKSNDPTAGSFLDIARGDHVVLNRLRISVDRGHLTIDLRGAGIWDPALHPHKAGCSLDYARMLGTFKDLLGMRGAISPFLAAVLERPVAASDAWGHAVQTEAVDIIDLICAGLGTCRPQTVLGGITRAVGLGCGFTPSGDDFLTGFVGAYRYLAPGDEMRKRVFAMMGLVIRRTTLPSFFMLRGALRGCLPETLADLLRATGNGSRADLAGALRRLTRTGATSGEDMLAGLLTYLVARAGTGCTYAAN